MDVIPEAFARHYEKGRFFLDHDGKLLSGTTRCVMQLRDLYQRHAFPNPVLQRKNFGFVKKKKKGTNPAIALPWLCRKLADFQIKGVLC